MRRLSLALLIVAVASLSNACIASKKFVRTEVKDSADTLNGQINKTNSRIDKTDGEVSEVRDGVTRVDGRVTGVDGRVTDLDTKTASRFESVNGAVKTVDQKAASAQAGVSALDEKFQNRNLYGVATEKAILFRFDSAKLDSKYLSDLEDVASVLQHNPDALVVLEGRTDATGDSSYNVKLGERRIDSVRRYLAVEKGVPVYKMHEISFGAEKPLAENKSREGREKNRTVIVTILAPKASAATATKNNNQN